MDTNVKRPSRTENEEDLLRMQEEFSRNPSKPSATVVKVKRKPDEKSAEMVSELCEPTSSIPVITEIKEKNLDVKEFKFRPPPKCSPKIAIPANLRVEGVEEQSRPFLSNSVDQTEECEDIKSLKGNVNKENTEKLSKMTEEEILDAQKEILEKLDPKLIEFLKRRGEQTETPKIRQQPVKVVEKSANNENPVATLPMEEFPIQPTSAWPHMDKAEPEKMAWMQSLPEGNTQKGFSTARFDFQGNIVTRNSEIPVSAGLHHHGTEPEAPGYTLEELLRLCRVQAINQRVLALNTLANIAARAKLGYYDDILLPVCLLRSLVESSVCTIVRYALDDTAVSVVAAACHLLAAFLHNSQDEFYLDVAYALSIDTIDLTLAPKETMGGSEDEEDADDEEICNRDMIMGLIRMGTLQRMRYLLEIFQPNSGQCITDIFAVLIRICRHGAKACRQVMQCPRLMEVIKRQFLPTAWRMEGGTNAFYPSYKAPYWGAVKLYRIVAASSKQLAQEMVEKYNIEHALIRYIVTEPEEMMMPLPDACQLIIESYRLWSELLARGLCHQYFSDLFETMVNHIRAAVSLQSATTRQFQWDRAAALVLVISNFTTCDKEHITSARMQLTGIVDVVVMALAKLLQESKTDADICFYYLIAALAKCCSRAAVCELITVDRKQLQTIATDLVPRFQASFGDRFSRDCSWPTASTVCLLGRDPACLPSLESVGGGGLIKMISERSMFPVFMCLKQLRELTPV